MRFPFALEDKRSSDARGGNTLRFADLRDMSEISLKHQSRGDGITSVAPFHILSVLNNTPPLFFILEKSFQREEGVSPTKAEP